MQFVLENGSRLIHETLRIDEKFVKARRLLENAHKGGAGLAQFHFAGRRARPGRRGSCSWPAPPRRRGVHRLRRDTAFANHDAPRRYLDLRRLDLLHFLNRGNGARGERIRLKFDPISRLGLDAIPQRLKFGAQLDFLFEAVGSSLLGAPWQATPSIW